MPEVTPIRDLRGYLEPEGVRKKLAGAKVTSNEEAN